MGISLLTFNGLERYAKNDESRTTKKDVKDWKNNRQMVVPLPDSPCP